MRYLLLKASDYALFAFLLVLPWQTSYILRELFIYDTKWEYATILIYASQVIFGIALVCFGLAFLLKKKHPFLGVDFVHSLFFTKKRRQFINIVMLMFFVFCFAFVRNLFTSDIWLGVQHLGYMVQAVLLIFLLISSGLSSMHIYKGVLFGSLIPLAIGVMQFFTQKTVASTLFGLAVHPVNMPGTSVIVSDISGRILRAYGTFDHPNVFGGFAVLLLTMTIILVKKEWQPKIYSVLVLLAIALFTSFSRSAYLAAAFVLLLHLPKRGYAQKVQGIAGIFAVVFVVLGVFNQDLVRTRSGLETSGYEQASISERVTLAKEADSIFDQHKLWGVGAGQYTHIVQRYMPYKPIWEYQPVHNALYLFIIEQGLIIAILGGYILYKLGVFLRSFSDQAYRDFWGIIVAISPMVLVDHYLYSSYAGLMFVAMFVGVVFVKHKALIKDKMRVVFLVG